MTPPAKVTLALIIEQQEKARAAKKAKIDRIIDITAHAFGMPREQLLKGGKHRKLHHWARDVAMVVSEPFLGSTRDTAAYFKVNHALVTKAKSNCDQAVIAAQLLGAIKEEIASTSCELKGKQ